MNEFLHMYIILCPMLFLAGFVDSVAGGGGLISLPAYLFVGIPIHLASGTNKVVNGIGTGMATFKYIQSGKVNLTIAIWAALGALVGGGIGARLALQAPEQVLKAIVLIALPIVAVILALKKDALLSKGIQKESGKNVVQSIGIGLIIGLYDGLIGPGTGTFLLMGFTFVLGMDLLTASGCAKVGNLASNVASAVVWILGGKVLWSLVLPGAASSVLGNYLGARYAIRGGSERVRHMIFVVLGLLFLKLLYDVLA